MNVKPLLVVFEGIDNSGKTSISQEVHRILRDDAIGVSMLHARENTDEFLSKYIGTSRNSWQWQKEPTFSTEEADRLNDPKVKMDQNEREVLFLASRLRQQRTYSLRSTILDRYLWTGMAYAKMFSPSCFDFTTKLYTQEDIFIMPDLTIFVDTPVELCHQREPEVSMDRLNGIRDAYLSTQQFVRGPVEIITGEGSLEENAKKAITLIQNSFLGNDSDRMKIDLEFPCPSSRYHELRTWKDKEVSNDEQA